MDEEAVRLGPPMAPEGERAEGAEVGEGGRAAGMAEAAEEGQGR